MQPVNYALNDFGVLAATTEILEQQLQKFDILAVLDCRQGVGTLHLVREFLFLLVVVQFAAIKPVVLLDVRVFLPQQLNELVSVDVLILKLLVNFLLGKLILVRCIIMTDVVINQFLEVISGD